MIPENIVPSKPPILAWSMVWDWDWTKIGAILATAAIGLAMWLRRRMLAHLAGKWPMTEATIESGRREVVARNRFGIIELPVFAFSYKVRGQYYPGRFALSPYITDPGDGVISRMIGRRLQIHYDPTDPSAWFIPDELIEGCRVEQKFDPHFISYPPKN